ncbi:PQ loop repeat-containing protein 3 precursor-like [Scleropages formosus]|uniref:PQ loop repeat-containing protein 3-like n=1 Tax=Scleropages formosus TaxID=113540 RepID=A0A0P7U1M2_SCLFO|nr:PQ-loop repeat-containing protein 3 [Scleropages formosus]KPP68002.1 PQ loop repeat-containing protein 3 precursor-like [Scleropages formosus]
MALDAALHAANLSTLLVCMVLKFPQMFAVLRAKSTEGVSVSSLVLELLGFIVFITYQVYYEYPPPTYLEYPILIAQDAALLLLILHYSRNLKQSFLYAAVFIGGWQLLTVRKWIIDLAMSLCTFISAGSKMAQLQCLWRSKDAGQVSALTWALATYTCLARIYTTIVTTGDMQVLVRFIVMTMLNGWVTATVLYYSRRRIKTD